ncbi:MAG: general secretion pathway protein GspB [Gammaproteobacteria bacterium]|jgi:general secretion pathway protein B|nr:hypothetical protein [Chromatiales bacterium]MDP6673423.1 general secretion pathway protein GspB [Gammaproteobacteria bacterium]
MSFILDALRKSENERREQTAPALSAAPQATLTNKRTFWLPILVVVLAINALIFGIIMLTSEEPVATVAEPLRPPVQAPTEVPVQVPAPAPAPVKPEVRSLREEAVHNTAAATPIDGPAATPETTPSALPDPPPSPQPTIQEGLPSLDQLRTAGLVSIGSLHIDMHVYSTDAAKRFVFVNMKKYREGDRLTEGPMIEAITPDGIIMVQQGNRFQMSRD